LPLSYFACAHCGFWQRHFAPPDCPVCTDTRNDLPEDGWRFLPETEVAATHDGAWRQVADDLWAFTTTPALGLAGTGWLIVRSDGNIAFEAAPYYSAAMLAQIAALGGIRFLAASHAHGYGALFQLQRAFAPEVAIHRDDLRMTKAFRVTWPYDDVLDIGGGCALHHVGGHYEGQAALHDAPGRRLFCGDMFKIDQDAGGRSTAISSHKAFHKDIPLTHAELRRYRDVIAPLDFDAVLTPFEYAPEVGRDVALRVLDEALARRPEVRRVPLDSVTPALSRGPASVAGQGSGAPGQARGDEEL
jgi:glyoxylase-like metal-dependent hydrolase (beta-lactamase superfamily II)